MHVTLILLAKQCIYRLLLLLYFNIWFHVNIVWTIIITLLYHVSAKHKKINNKNGETFNIRWYFYNKNNEKSNNEKSNNNHSTCTQNIHFLVVFVEFLLLFECDNLFGREQCWKEHKVKVFTTNKKILKISVFFFANTEIVASN